MNLLMLGCGNMGGAMLQAWLPLVEETWQELWILRASPPQKQKLEQRLKPGKNSRQSPRQPSRQGPGVDAEYAYLAPRFHFVGSFTELQQKVQERNLRFSHIVFAMKPQVIRREMQNCLKFCLGGLCLTMAAGLPLHWYREQAPDLRLVRIMPNLGAQVGLSASLVYKELALLPDEQQVLERMIRSIGSFVWCRSEEQLDCATPVTGSGPAYFYLLTEILEQILLEQGFDGKDAAVLAENTLLGAAGYLCDMRGAAADKNLGLAQHLRRAVTSKAGVTEAALSALLPSLPAIVAQAIDRGIVRNRDLQQG